MCNCEALDIVHLEVKLTGNTIRNPEQVATKKTLIRNTVLLVVAEESDMRRTEPAVPVVL